MVEHLTRMCKALGLIPGAEKDIYVKGILEHAVPHSTTNVIPTYTRPKRIKMLAASTLQQRLSLVSPPRSLSSYPFHPCHCNRFSIFKETFLHYGLCVLVPCRFSEVLTASMLICVSAPRTHLSNPFRFPVTKT